MKYVAWIKKQYVYPILITTLAITWVINNYVTFSLTLEGLRILAVVVATVTGLLCGLVAATAALMVQISTSQKQFNQGLLANVSQWFKDWFNTHTTIPGLNSHKVKHLLYLLDRHSTVAAASDEEVFDLVAKVLLPLPKKWLKMISKTPGQLPLQEEEIEEFQNHLEQIGATVGQIKASKDRLDVAKSLGSLLWSLTGALMLALGLIILASIPDISKTIGEIAAPLALMILEVIIILIGGVIFVITSYLRAEHKEATRIVES